MAGARHQRTTSIGEYLTYHIGTLTTAGPADPSVTAAGTATTGGTLATGNYYVSYAWVNSNGTSKPATISIAVAISNPTSNAITTTAVSPPSGCTVNWYVGQTNNVATLQLVGNNSGAAFLITALPAASAALTYPVSTTAPRVGLPTNITGVSPWAYGSTSTSAITLGHGDYLSSVILNAVGSSVTLTIFNGNSGTANSIVSQITPTTNVTLHYDCLLEGGMYYTYLGTTAGSATISLLPCPV